MPGADREDVDEDDAVLSAFQELAQSHPRLLLILVPRKPERFDEAEAEAARRGRALRSPVARDASPPIWRCPAWCCSIPSANWPACFPSPTWSSWEARWRGAAGTMFWNRRHAARAIVTGPHLENFAAIAAEFREQRAFLEIAGAKELAGAVAKVDRRSRIARRSGRSCRGAGCQQARRHQKSRVRNSPLAGSGRSTLEPVEPGAIPALAAGSRFGPR